MEFGLFDHVDLRGDTPGRVFDDRLEFVAAADQAGFKSYHVAEHHMTPLGMAPSPSVYLAAVARETEMIRIGPLVYLLPLYIPLRLIEEICMLDQLSNGRLELGVGRGVSKYEVGYYGVDVESSWGIFHETLDILVAGLTGDRLNHHGPQYDYSDVPMVLRPVQKPMPPVWYGVGGPDGQDFAARTGMNMVILGPTSRIRDVAVGCRSKWNEYRDHPDRLPGSPKEPVIAATRNIVVADTDGEAEGIARPAYAHWYGSLAKLWIDHGDTPSAAIISDYDVARECGMMVVGSPDTVRAELASQVEECDINRIIAQMAFGDMSHADEMRSLHLFATEIMPEFQEIGESK
jgi:alkanesulfonate monooxygenase SsuD/methylene tetrahydromethanopterin reductase-like flavin-dependent oxidoreductase (luciferase family)